MGIGPAYAIPKLLSALGLSKDDIDAFEINEAFASMLAYTVETLGLDHEKVNPKGGAIAFGHPLGATGARFSYSRTSLLMGLDKLLQDSLISAERSRKLSLLPCVSVFLPRISRLISGTGMGAAALFINEAN